MLLTKLCRVQVHYLNLLVIMQKHNSKTAMIIYEVHSLFLLDGLHLIDYFKDVILHTTLSIQSGVCLTEVFNNKN